MAAPISPPLPPAWSRILEEIESALTTSLSQVAEPAKSMTFAKPVQTIAVPEMPDAWPAHVSNRRSVGRGFRGRTCPRRKDAPRLARGGASLACPSGRSHLESHKIKLIG